MLIYPILLTILMVLVICTDAARYKIYNWQVLIALVLYPAMCLTSPHLPEGYSVAYALAVAVGMFCFGFVLFSLRLFGGGDVKLLAALSLWTATACTLELLAYMTVIGGLMIVLLVLVREILDPNPIAPTKLDGAKKLAVSTLSLVDKVRYSYRLLVSPLRAVSKRLVNYDKVPRLLRHGEPMAYGLAIAAAFLIVLWTGKIPGLPV